MNDDDLLKKMGASRRIRPETIHAWWVWIQLAFVVLMISIQPFTCQVAEDDAERILEGAGIEDVEITDFVWFCGDVFRSGWKGTNSHGDEVNGCIGCGWLKDCTIRYE